MCTTSLNECPNPPSHIGYRPEIDGLRAIAVIAVILYHADEIVPGGFVGVDVFFVISGYLLTSIILNDIRAGRFTFWSFWERRARRILPPAAIVTVFVLIAGWFVLLPNDYQSVGRSVIAQTLFVANVYFWKTTSLGYFGSHTNEMPLLHTWSLAVEEQFYFLLPFLLVIASRIRQRGWIKPVPLCLWCLFAASLAANLHGIVYRPNTTFYLLPARAWELACGSLLAITPPGPWTANRLVREFAALCGSAAVLIPCFVYDRHMPFPGGAALPPVLGAALIIWSSSHSLQSAKSSLVARVLSTRAFVAIGLLSYSLYLWHWPLFAFMNITNSLFERPSSWITKLGLVAVSFLLAWISYRYVEVPLRRKKFCASQSALVSLVAGTAVCLVIMGITLEMKRGIGARFSPRAVEFAATTGPVLTPTTLDDIANDRLTRIGDVESGDPPTVLLWGDSHAVAVSGALDAFLKEKRLNGMMAMRPATAPVLQWFFTYKGINKLVDIGGDAPEYNSAICEYAIKNHFRNVLLIGRWELYLVQNDREMAGKPIKRDTLDIPSFEGGLVTLIRRLREAGIVPWLMLQVPSHHVNVPRALVRCEVYGGDKTLIGQAVADASNACRVPFDLERVRAAGCRILDPTREFANPTTGRIDVIRDGVTLYCDDNHLTELGSRKILLPFIRREFSPE